MEGADIGKGDENVGLGGELPSPLREKVDERKRGRERVNAAGK